MIRSNLSQLKPAVSALNALGNQFQKTGIDAVSGFTQKNTLTQQPLFDTRFNPFQSKNYTSVVETLIHAIKAKPVSNPSASGTSNMPPPITGLALDKVSAKLSNVVYDSNRALPKGWSRVSKEQLSLLGLENVKFSDDQSGFKSALYRNNETGQYVYAFAGTEDAKDWVNNFQQGLGNFSTQYDMAINNTKLINKAVRKNLTLTGHSLGGGLASAAAVVSNVKATTFNAAGVTDKTLARYGANGNMAKDLISAYYVKGEVLSTLQDFSPLADALGKRIKMKSTKSMPPFLWLLPKVAIANQIKLSIDRHGMDEVLPAMEKNFGK